MVLSKSDAVRPRMVTLALSCFLVVCTCCRSQKAEQQPFTDTAPAASVDTSPYAITIEQSDGTTLQIMGKGNRNNPYAETIDGYTVLRNDKKIYEYAVPDKNGQLVLSGVKANDPDKRKPSETAFLNTLEKHLRNKY